MKVAFHQGSGLAVVGPGGAGLVDAHPGDPLVHVLVSAIGSNDPDVGRLARRLTDLGVDGLPAFAIVLDCGVDVTALVHGAIVGSIGEGDDAEALDAAGVATWIERAITRGPVRFSLDCADMPTGALWIDGGVVPAGSISIYSGLFIGAEANGDASVVVSTEPPVVTDAESGIEETEPGAVNVVPSAALDADVQDDQEIDQEVAEDRSAAIDTPDSTVFAQEEDQDEATEFDFTHLVDHTVYRDSRDAEVRPDEAVADDDDPVARDPESDSARVGEVEASGVGPVTIPPDPTESVPALIDWVPSGGDAERDPDDGGDGMGPGPTAHPPPGRPGDHDGHTVATGPGGAPRNAKPSVGESDPKLVNGVLCPRGHANSPVADRCMVCREVLTDRSVRRMERPSLGRLVLPSGETIEVDRPIVIGRMPVATELIGGEVPVTLKIDDDVVTRNHAQVLIDEWHVLIVDLKSTNETMVTIPGQAPRVLAPHDPCVLLAGTEIDLGGFGPVLFEGPV